MLKEQLKEKIIELNYEILVNFDNKVKVKKLRDQLLTYINIYLQNNV